MQIRGYVDCSDLAHSIKKKQYYLWNQTETRASFYQQNFQTVVNLRTILKTLLDFILSVLKDGELK